MPYCPACGGEFVDRVSQCPDCDVRLVSTLTGDGDTRRADHPERPIWPVVLESGDSAELSAAQSALDGAGIEHLTEGESLQDLEGAGRLGTGFSLVSGPARLRVPPRQEAAARELLSDLGPLPDGEGTFEPDSEDLSAPSEEPRRTERRRTGLLAAFAGGLLLGLAAPHLLQRGEADGARRPAETEEQVISEDTDGDGEPDTWMTYRGTLLVLEERDRDGDGRRDLWSRFDSLGRAASAEEDSDFDGRKDTWFEFQEGRMESIVRDGNGDGRPDSWTHFDGELMTAEQMDVNFDGRPDIWYSYQNSQLVEGREDTDFDGTVDFVVRYQHSLPVEGVWEPRPGAPGRKVVYRDGQRREELRDLDGDGRYDRRILFNGFEYPVEETAIR